MLIYIPGPAVECNLCTKQFSYPSKLWHCISGHKSIYYCTVCMPIDTDLPKCKSCNKLMTLYQPSRGEYGGNCLPGIFDK